MKETKRVRFLLTNDGGNCYPIDEPMGVEHLHKQVDMLIGTEVDTLCWNLGLPGAYRYDTKVSTRWGQELDKMTQARFYRVKENLEALVRQGIDPLRVILDRGKEKGIKVYPSVRIYDCQMGGELDPLNREHPEWQIGEYPRHGPASAFKAASYLTQLDHAQPEVRERMVKVVDELLDRYQVEGLELDFERRPHFFKPDEAVENRHLMTDMLRQMRAAARRAGEARGRPVEVIARMWMNLSDCWNLGLDIETWVKEGLIDMVMPTNHYFFALDHPIEAFVELTRGTPVQVVIAYCPVVSQTPPGANPELPDTWAAPTSAGRPVAADVEIPYIIPDDAWHAGAQVAFAKGAQGLSTFNLSFIARLGAEWDLTIQHELHDPALVARHDKFYPYITQESANRPQRLGRDAVSYSLYMADDPGAVSRMTLAVYITQTTTKDRIAFSMNGGELEMTRRLTRPDPTDGLQAPEVDPHHFFECELTDAQARHGDNELTIQLIERNPEVASPLTVVGVNIAVAYES